MSIPTMPIPYIDLIYYLPFILNIHRIILYVLNPVYTQTRPVFPKFMQIRQWLVGLKFNPQTQTTTTNLYF
jgi:hypothetical protein